MSPTPPFCWSAAHFPAQAKPENPSNFQCLWYSQKLIKAFNTIAHAHLLVGVIRGNSKSIQMSADLHVKHQYLHAIPAFSRKALNSMSSRSSWTTDGMQQKGCRRSNWQQLALLSAVLEVQLNCRSPGIVWYSFVLTLAHSDQLCRSLPSTTLPCFIHSCDFNFRA